MKLLLSLITIVFYVEAAQWLPFANFNPVLENVNDMNLNDTPEDVNNHYSFSYLASEVLPQVISHNAPELAVTTKSPIHNITFPYTFPHVSSYSTHHHSVGQSSNSVATNDLIPTRQSTKIPAFLQKLFSIKISSATPTTSIPDIQTVDTTESRMSIWLKKVTTALGTTPYPIWPTTRHRSIAWKPVQVTAQRNIPHTTTSINHIVSSIPNKTSTQDSIPLRTTSSTSSGHSCQLCEYGTRCSVRLRSFETSDSVFQYAYNHSTTLDDTMQNMFRETQMMSYPNSLSWHNSVSPEVLQLVQTIMTLNRPLKCLIIGVFTGLSVLGIAQQMDSNGLVVALEHPEYAQFWRQIGVKYAEKDDLKRENYIYNYEYAMRMLKNGGIIIITQVRATLLPYGGGTWIVTKK
uniref:S-adenosyl-L-methionine-dependent methyltransferase n=1 Tax=Heterorhabditis bacteriophora TaxID=37862 RepID=A0A1I7WX27_HETBA